MMQKKWCWAFWAILVSVGPASAQPVPPSLPPASALEPVPSSTLPPAAALEAETPVNVPFSRFWCQAEYLRWQVHTPVPIPIVTTGNPNDGPLAGTIGQAATHVLFGNNDLDYPFFPGLRFAMGVWFDREREFGLEQSFTYFQSQTSVFHVASDAAGNPPIYLSGFNAVLGREDSAILADPSAQFAGSATVTTDLHLWGAELNGLAMLWSTKTVELHLLGGLRYVNLQESLQVDASSRDLVVDSSITSRDRFETLNRFLGSQFGLRCRWQPGCFSYELTGKLALGGNHQVVNVQGENSAFGSFAVNPGTSPGGFYAQPTNIGSTSHVKFALAPSLDMKADFQFTPHIHAFISYGLFAVTQVVRPGNQIDRDLNLSKSPIFASGPISDIAAPRPLFNRSTLFADGISIGVEFRF